MASRFGEISGRCDHYFHGLHHVLEELGNQHLHHGAVAVRVAVVAARLVSKIHKLILLLRGLTANIRPICCKAIN